MDSEDGQLFIKRLAQFVRTHEKALANALQQRQQPRRDGAQKAPTSGTSAQGSAFSLPSLPFTSSSVKPAKLSLTPHHLYYLLTRFEELNIQVGPMNVRLENIHADTAPGNYVSFLRNSSTRIARRSRSSDSLSIHSASSVRSVMTGVSSIWTNIGFGSSITARQEKAKAALEADLKYLYSAFTKVPCLKLAPDRKAKLVEGFEEFPFDTAVPLLCFKNTSALEISDIDIRQFYGWDRLAEQLRSLIVKRAGIDDPAELLISIVLDDMDRRRRRSAKTQSSPIIPYSVSTPASTTDVNALSAPASPASPTIHSGSAPSHYHPMSRGPSGHSVSRSSSKSKDRPRSSSPSKTPTKRNTTHRMRRSGSGSSHNSQASTSANPNPAALPPSKWRFLRHLSIADNSLHTITAASLTPVAGSLTSLDLSSNLFTAIPESLAILTNLRALNLSSNMIDSLHSLTRCPLPAITALNLRNNRLSSLAGIERLVSLERIDLRENNLTDPTELARLTGLPNVTAIWVSGNPFTKTHSNYRTTIFNLFRTTPGYTEDITLDSQPPGMMEKRSLVDRVNEVPPVPVVKVSKPQPVAVHQIAPLESKTREKKTVANVEVARAKKKAGRRRVVELTRDDSSTSVVTDDSQTIRAVKPRVASGQKRVASNPVKHLSHVTDEASSGAESDLAADGRDVGEAGEAGEEVDWVGRGDEYRRRVEQLKREVGEGWLSVLSQEGVDLDKGPSTAAQVSV